MALTPKQSRFVENYLLDLNATQAAIRAGYSAKTANEQGPRLLAHPEIKAAIDAAKIERSERTEIEAERVLKEIAAMAFYDPADLIGTARELEAGAECQNGEGVVEINGKRYAVAGIVSPAHIAGLPENVRRAIIGWSWDRNQNFTLKLADKSKALDQLARHLSLYNDRLEVTSVEALGDRIARAKARALNVVPALPSASNAPPVSVEAVQEAPAADRDRGDDSNLADRLSRAKRSTEAAPSSPPAPPPPAPKPYKPIMPTPEPARPWPTFGGFAATDYDPTT
ncbi:terminase small subunit [Bradyrhizobium tunisiense]|uniref:terminase small subunit n=1 Tax=Bradyrhizobium tunisiense TaxID=3278709 RepID=UPI0035D7A57A